jgi:hypothetical protein
VLKLRYFVDGYLGCSLWLQFSYLFVLGSRINNYIIAAWCKLTYHQQHIVFCISTPTCAIHNLSFQGDPVEIARVIKDSVKQNLKRFHEEARHSLISTPERKLALIIDGRCLMYALDPTLRVDLLGLSLSCHSVICCRVSPLQKAQVNNVSCRVPFSSYPLKN